jgi:uncharacterized protein
MSDTSTSPTGSSLPIACACLALGLVIAAWVLANGITDTKRIESQVLSVTGSAQQAITSDKAVWKGRFSRQGNNLAEAFKILRADNEKVKAFLASQGFKPSDIELSPVENSTLYQQTSSGSSTNQIEGYRFTQNVTVESPMVDHITRLSQEATNLVEQGVGLESDPPEYLYTRLDTLKVAMLGKAMENAKLRAMQMAKSAGNSIGSIRSAQMGVFQITPKNSTEISDYGVNDTSSKEKNVTAVVNTSFQIR